MAPAPALRVDDLVAPNANPIMRAGGPLLLLLGRLRVALLRASFASLMEQVADAIKFFEKDIRSAGISEQQANSAKYILCATADDIVQHIPTDDRHVWAQYSMLSRFFGERVGGVRFFEILTHHKLDPLMNYPVLELQHACLALGFQGMYRANPSGLATLQQIQRDLYETLRRVRPKVMSDLSPHWQGQSLAIDSTRVRVPVWVVSAAAGVLLFGTYVMLRLLLSGNSEAIAAQTATMHPIEKIEVHRILPAPPPPPPPPPPPTQVTQVQRIRNNIPSQIGDCRITVDQTATQIVIRLCDITFRPGQADVLDQFKPVATRIGAVVNDETGKIKVVGHTDSNPIKNVRFPSNWHLSMERAKAVAALIKSSLTDPSRVSVDGKGADAPIASNSTPEGRRRNRRVEVQIGRSNE
jgi:type VI secretion system protein ImpK